MDSALHATVRNAAPPWRNQPGEFRRHWVLYIAVVGASAAVAGVAVMTDGSIEAAAAVVVALAILVLTFYRADLAFLLFLGMVVLFDQFIVVPFGDPWTDSVRYFDNLKQIPFLPPVSAGVMNPLEVQLALMVFAWFLTLSARKTMQLQPVPLWGFGVLLLGALGFSLVRGLGSGGDFLPALWEVRAPFYFLLLCFFVPQIIQTREQVTAVAWLLFAMVLFKDLQGAMRFAALGFRFNGNACLTNHEDPVFTVDLLMLLIGLGIFGARTRLRIVMLLCLPVLLLGFYAGQRRAAYAAFLVCILSLVPLLRQRERTSFLRVLAPALVLFVCYAAVFWNSDSGLGAPVQLLKSGFFQDKADDGSHYTSNLYRMLERYDLAVTARSAPLLGTGFGKKYLQPLPLVPIPFPLRDWIPHDEILWLIVNMGGIGFFIFWLFINGLLLETTTLGRRLKDPFLRAVCFMIAAAIVSQMVVSYFDLQLTYYRNMIVLGTLCGLLPALKSLGEREPGDQMPAVPVPAGQYPSA